MTKVASKLTAIIFCLIIMAPMLAMMIGGDIAGSDGGRLTSNTSLQLIPQSDSVGGGRIRWTLEGQAAVELRQALIDSVGNTDFFEQADGTDTLNERELQLYLGTSGMLESYLQRGDALEGGSGSFRNKINFFGFEPRRDIDRYDYINYYGTPIERSSLRTSSIRDNTKGLLGVAVDSPEPVIIDFTISFFESPGSGPFDIDMANTEVMEAVWNSLIIPVRKELITDATLPVDPEDRTFYIEHTDLLSDGDDNYGLILRNGNRLDSDNFTTSSDGRFTINEASIEEGDDFSLIYAYTYRWEGESRLRHRSFVVGTHSYYEPEVEDGTLYLIRTPAGQILQYSIDLNGRDPGKANIRWAEFTPLENPQILFVLVCVFGYMTRHFPKRFYWDYKDEFPTKYRKKAEKSKILHGLSAVAVVLLFVLYVFPMIGHFYVSGLILILIGSIVMVLFGVLSYLIYSKMKGEIPEEILNPPKRAPRKVSSVKKTTIRTTVPVIVGQKKQSSSNVCKTYCDWCGEFFTIHKNRNLLTVRCPSCKKRQQMLKEGYNYLLFDSDSENSFSIVQDFLMEGLPVMVLTTTMPSKVEERYGLHGANVIWLSENAYNEFKVLNPKKLDDDITSTINNYSRNNERAMIFLDNLEYLIVENSFDEVIKFIKKTIDTCSLNASTYLISLNPEAFSGSELSVLKKEFDHHEDLRLPGKK